MIGGSSERSELPIGRAMFLVKHRKANDKNWIFDHYDEYLNSLHWKLTKALFSLIPLLGTHCYVCTDNGRWELHHKTYKRVGEERARDLIRLCPACHKQVGREEDRGTPLMESHKVVRKSDWGRKRRRKVWNKRLRGTG